MTYSESGWSERTICGRTFMVPPPEHTQRGFVPFDLVIPDPPVPVDPNWLKERKNTLRRSPVYTPPLPTECYDASFGRIHVQPHCRCPKVKGKRK